MARGVLARDRLDADTAEDARRTREVLVDEVLVKTDRLEGLSACIGAHGRDAHLGHDLEHALAEALDDVAHRRLGREARDHAGAHEVLDSLHREVGVDGGGAEADEERDVVHLAHVSRLDDDADAHALLGADEMVVHRGEQQQGGDRREIGVRVAIAQHDELRAVVDRFVDLGAHRRQSLLERLGAAIHTVEPADRLGERAARPRIDVLDLRELVIVDHGEVEDDLARVPGCGREQVALRPEAEPHRGHDLFPDRVEGWVRDLRELLGEVVEDEPRTIGEHGDRSVGPHGAEGLGTRPRHGGEENAHLLLRVAEGALAAHDRGGGVHDVLPLREILEVDALGLQPLAPRAGCGDLALDLVVLDDAALGGVDEEHPARAQPALAHDAGRIDVEHADLAREHDEAVLGDEKTPGTQPVAVEGRADEVAVGEGQRRRAVPRLHEHAVVLVEASEVGVDIDLVLPRLGHHHHDRVRQWSAPELEKLDDLVERCRVARAGRDDREHVAQIAEHLVLELRLSGAHPVAVALHGVDLAVVRHHAERLRERPRREGVRRVARVHESELRREALLAQVGVERLELERRDHALVDECAARERGEVRPELALGALAQTEGLAVESDADERLALGVVTAGPHEELLEGRHRRARQVADVVGVDGHLAPAEDLEVLLAGDALDLALLGRPLVVVGGQEGHADGVRPHGR